MRTVAVITSSRADYSIYRPLLHRIVEHPELSLRLLVTGMHLAEEFGHTVDQILADGFTTDERVDMLLPGDKPEDTALSMARGMEGFARVFAHHRPDILLALGDRFEMHAAVIAAVPFGIPIAHIAGGVTTTGAIDEVFRHGITKAAHIHFTETEIYARRLIRMGEHPDRVHVTGALALDDLLTRPPPGRTGLESRYGGPWPAPPVLVTFHPVTLEYEKTEYYIGQLLTALSDIKRPLIFTYPNADTGGKIIIRRIREFADSHPHAVAVPSMGDDYAGMLAIAGAMVGNSSSGLVEAPSFKLPVVNIGRRQHGRLAPANVIQTDCEMSAIKDALKKALTDEFRHSLANLINPYGDGHAADKMINVLTRQPLDTALIQKEFYDG